MISEGVKIKTLLGACPQTPLTHTSLVYFTCKYILHPCLYIVQPLSALPTKDCFLQTCLGSLSTSEIAELLCIGVSSVHQYRDFMKLDGVPMIAINELQ